MIVSLVGGVSNVEWMDGWIGWRGREKQLREVRVAPHIFREIFKDFRSSAFLPTQHLFDRF